MEMFGDGALVEACEVSTGKVDGEGWPEGR